MGVWGWGCGCGCGWVWVWGGVGGGVWGVGWGGVGVGVGWGWVWGGGGSVTTEITLPWLRHEMETFSANSPVTDEVPSDAELLCFLWSAPEPTIEQTIETLVIWDAIALIMTSFLFSIHTSTGLSSTQPTTPSPAWLTIHNKCRYIPTIKYGANNLFITAIICYCYIPPEHVIGKFKWS